MRSNSDQRPVKQIRVGNHTILGRSLSSFACSYSVSMLSAERKKSDGCEISKSEESDIASTAKRCVLYARARTAGQGCELAYASPITARK